MRSMSMYDVPASIAAASSRPAGVAHSAVALSHQHTSTTSMSVQLACVRTSTSLVLCMSNLELVYRHNGSVQVGNARPPAAPLEAAGAPLAWIQSRWTPAAPTPAASASHPPARLATQPTPSLAAALPDIPGTHACPPCVDQPPELGTATSGATQISPQSSIRTRRNTGVPRPGPGHPLQRT